MVDKPPFAVWAPSEITRLREQADALERALHLYMGNADAIPHKATPRSSGAGNGTGRGSKYESVFSAFEKECRVLSLDEMIKIAARLGFNLNRSNMRSQVFAQKKVGRAHPQGDGYIWGLSNTKNESSAPIADADDL